MMNQTYPEKRGLADMVHWFTSFTGNWACPVVEATEMGIVKVPPA